MCASRRTGKENFITCMRHTLAGRYGDQPVGIGGVFVIEKGKAKIHVMVNNEVQIKPLVVCKPFANP